MRSDRLNWPSLSKLGFFGALLRENQTVTLSSSFISGSALGPRTDAVPGGPMQRFPRVCAIATILIHVPTQATIPFSGNGAVPPRHTGHEIKYRSFRMNVFSAKSWRASVSRSGVDG